MRVRHTGGQDYILLFSLYFHHSTNEIHTLGHQAPYLILLLFLIIITYRKKRPYVTNYAKTSPLSNTVRRSSLK